jgi:hypothetical protein
MVQTAEIRFSVNEGENSAVFSDLLAFLNFKHRSREVLMKDRSIHGLMVLPFGLRLRNMAQGQGGRVELP